MRRMIGYAAMMPPPSSASIGLLRHLPREIVVAKTVISLMSSRVLRFCAGGRAMEALVLGGGEVVEGRRNCAGPSKTVGSLVCAVAGDRVPSGRASHRVVAEPSPTLLSRAMRCPPYRRSNESEAAATHT
eukprot:630228-Alexandrium_andersonii.AAC.3